MSIDKLRRVCLFFIVVSVIFVTIAIFTDEWFVWKSKCMEFVRLTKGLWSECGNNQTLTLISWLNPECRFCQACPCQACAFTPEHFICGPLGIVQKLRWRAAPFPEPQEYIKSVRGLMISGLVLQCTTVLSIIVMLVWKRRLYMDVITVETIIPAILIATALFIYSEKNETITYDTIMVGYSYIMGWLGFGFLFVAGLLSFLSRLDPEEKRRRMMNQ